MIIVGFGVSAKLWHDWFNLQHQTFTAIDSNIDKVDFARKPWRQNSTMVMPLNPGYPACSRYRTCQSFVLAIDDIEDSNECGTHIRLNYPDLNLLVRVGPTSCICCVTWGRAYLA